MNCYGIGVGKMRRAVTLRHMWRPLSSAWRSSPGLSCHLKLDATFQLSAAPVADAAVGVDAGVPDGVLTFDTRLDLAGRESLRERQLKCSKQRGQGKRTW